MMTEVIPAGLGRDQPLAVLSGPTFAVELMQGLPTAIVAASTDKNLAGRVQRLFASTHLRVNTSNDVVGVELSGALKNVLAIAAGMIEGLELGNNALAAVVAQGCAEIRWLATKMGAKPETLSGLSGTGDIMLTCFVPLRRVLIISTPVPVLPRSRRERRSLRSLVFHPVAYLSVRPHHGFNPDTPASTSLDSST